MIVLKMWRGENRIPARSGDFYISSDASDWRRLRVFKTNRMFTHAYSVSEVRIHGRATLNVFLTARGTTARRATRHAAPRARHDHEPERESSVLCRTGYCERSPPAGR